MEKNIVEIWDIEIENNQDAFELIKPFYTNLEEDKKRSYLSDPFWKDLYLSKAHKVNEGANKYNYLLLDKERETLNVLEKYVYDIAIFHLNRLNIELNEDIQIEYWLNYEFKNIKNNLHVDHQEFDKYHNDVFITPFLSTITYFNDNPYPTLLTNMEDNESTNPESINMSFVFPQKNKHISFDGGKYLHGQVNVFNDRCLIDKNKPDHRYILVMNLWDKKHTHRPFYIENDSEIFSKRFNKLDRFVNVKPTSNNAVRVQIIDDYLLSKRFLDDSRKKLCVSLYYKFASIFKAHDMNKTRNFICFK